jgi:hypothetical protein
MQNVEVDPPNPSLKLRPCVFVMKLKKFQNSEYLKMCMIKITKSKVNCIDKTIVSGQRATVNPMQGGQFIVDF